MDKRVPIGSVIKVKQTKALVLGNKMIERDGKLTASVIVVKYPLGYTGLAGIGCIPMNQIDEILHVGYEDKNAKKYYDASTALNEQVEGLTPEEAQKKNQELEKEWKAASARLSDYFKEKQGKN